MYQIGKPVNKQPRERCEDRCEETKGCLFYFYNTWCVLYSGCDQTRRPGLMGKTYKKLGIPGLRFRFYSNQNPCFIELIVINHFCEHIVV